MTVVHERCAIADAYATALMVLGPEEGMAVAEKEGLAALFLIRTGPEEFSQEATTRFRQYLAAMESQNGSARRQ